MSDGPLLLEAFPHAYDAAHERRVPGEPRGVVYYPGARRDGGSDGAWLRISPRGLPACTGVFSSDNLPGLLNVVASWPEPHTMFVAAGGPPYLVDVRDPDRWSRIERQVRVFEPVGALALLLDGQVLPAYDAAGLAWESDGLGLGTSWLGVLDDEVHLRSGDLRYRVDLRHGRTVTERMPG